MVHSKWSKLLTLLILTISLFKVNSNGVKNDEAGVFGVAPKTYMANFTKRHGYPMEKFETVTEDGYILTLYLLPQKGEERWRSKTVFLNHGFLSSSDHWFLNHPDARLPFKLYDEKYNVMLGNFRGTTHSNRHVKWSKNSTQYWNFSWDELARLDLAAMIDLTLKVMRQGKIFLIGHSMGTTTTFALLAEKPEYNDKLYRFIALSPVAFEFRSTSPLRRYLAPFLRVRSLQKIFLLTATPHGMFPPGYARLEIIRKGCAAVIVGKSEQNSSHVEIREAANCKRFYRRFDIGEEEIGKESFEALLSIPLETASVKTLIHYSQLMSSGHFRRYDYGSATNSRLYDTPMPPDYDLSKVTCPTSLFWGSNDTFANDQDVAKLVQKLSTNLRRLETHRIDSTPWNHFDYVFSKKSAVHLNPHILRSLKSTKLV